MHFVVISYKCCVPFLVTLGVEGLCLLYVLHATPPDTFCYLCGEMTFKFQMCNFIPLIEKCYELGFGCKVGDEDKS
jgi:hypothetical protein